MDKNGVGALCNGGVDQRQAGCDTADNALDLVFALDLQPVGAVVFKALGLQQVVQRAAQRVS